MKTVLGTTGLIAAALFLSAPAAQAEAVELEDVAVSLSAGGPNTETEIGLGSVSVGSANPGGAFIDFGSVRIPLG
ncbi:hypothetical protein [Nocardia sp. NPDC005978]|uniref:hypothetical protein n=1 Tax=unclassified Nocardia TaxID=2637762 RepID=UPI0033B343D8